MTTVSLQSRQMRPEEELLEVGDAHPQGELEDSLQVLLPSDLTLTAFPAPAP